MAAVLHNFAEPEALSGIALSDLAPGVNAQVIGIAPPHAGGPRELVRRLSELGFLPGETVRIVARGFLARDPLAVRIGTGTFALRRHEASVIWVLPELPLRA
jgi:ferrous iron transport protein A